MATPAIVLRCKNSWREILFITYNFYNKKILVCFCTTLSKAESERPLIIPTGAIESGKVIASGLYVFCANKVAETNIKNIIAIAFLLIISCLYKKIILFSARDFQNQASSSHFVFQEYP